ncbi:MAG TPA: tryptophan synthase subunit alpha [Ktedonobacteraceae bacterium]|nr:tryptophan synthase subunit alpha [Ktedonobacteraceae bacterium]
MQTANQNPQNTGFDTTMPASRISKAFQKARHEGRGVLIPYFMCGYPSAAQSIELVLAAVRGGADIIELGIPFSDPLADGATIQHAGHVALEGGMTIQGCMEIARQISAQCDTSLIFMGYYNPILAYGIERFCQHATASGICGLIIPDLPPEEAAPLQDSAQKYGISLNFLIPPTASGERIFQILQAASDTSSFIYCVSLSGVTGARTTLPPHLRSFVARVYGYMKGKPLPVAVGFGLSTPEHIAEVFRFADGAVVGSALVKIIDQHDESEQVQAVKCYIENLLRNTGE